MVNNNYQLIYEVSFTLVLKKAFGESINISPRALTILKTFNSEFSFFEIWFINQNNKYFKIHVLQPQIS